MAPPVTAFPVGLSQEFEQQQLSLLQKKRQELIEGLKQALEAWYPSELATMDSLKDIADGIQAHSFAGHFTKSMFSELIAKLNAALWSYVENLEGYVTDLFERISQTDISSWDQSLAAVIDRVAFTLQHDSKDALNFVMQLEEHLWKISDGISANSSFFQWIRRLIPFSKTLLDRQLASNLRHTITALDVQYLGWKNRFEDYKKYELRTHHSIMETSSYSLFQTLPQDSRNVFLQVQGLLKVWEADANAKAILLADLSHALRQKMRFEDIYNIFRDYYNVLKTTLFSTSHKIKEHNILEGLPEQLLHHQEESRALKHTVACYREFLLRTDPNPYVRSRWGFPEWVVGPEPESTRKLLRLEYQLETLDNLYGALIKAVSQTSLDFKGQVSRQAADEISDLLHAMSQPMLTQSGFVSDVQQLMLLVELYDELGNTSPESISFVTDVLLKALKYDLHHSVLFNNAIFHKVYSIHHELVKPILADPQHQQAVETVKQSLSRVLKAAKRNHDDKLTLYIGTLIDEMKEQNERLANCEAAVRNEFALDFRFLIAQFYHQLNKEAIQVSNVRNQLSPLDHI